jgi:tetraacyldisaccharide 4'-kinase
MVGLTEMATEGFSRGTIGNRLMSLLPDADALKRLVDGSARGPAAVLARATLAAIALPYRLAVAARNAAYDRRLLAIASAPVPVVSIGNLTLGGTGKTPLVAWCVQTLASAGLRPAIVSRGYGARPGEKSDEAAELAILLPGVPHVANRDRVAGARTAAAAGADVVVLDDGFQHRRLARDLDIVAVDATDPFGCNAIFPRGLLREPLANLSRAQACVLTRASMVDAARREAIRTALGAATRGRMPAVWAEAAHRPVQLRTASGATLPLDALHGKRIAAFAGIGNPAAFRRSLESLGAELVAFRPLADHHAYDTGDIEAIAAWARSARADLAITTLKDLVKLRVETLAGIPLAAVEIAFEIMAGRKPLESLLLRAGGRGRTTH